MEKHQVAIINLRTQEMLSLEINADEGETTENIILSIHVDNHKITGEDYHYFPAFQKLRDTLLQCGYGMKCNGARINVVQSEMMGSTEKVYLFELGNQALKKDIVSLYDFADISIFPNTEEQLTFFEQWSSSL